MLGISNGQPLTKSPFLPDLRPGQYGGQEALRVSAWSVDDVAKWLKVSGRGNCVFLLIDEVEDRNSVEEICEENV